MKVKKNLEQEVLPVVLIVKIMREKNSSEIKFMLEGENLIHDDGIEFVMFL
jgi:hypothetical protein